MTDPNHFCCQLLENVDDIDTMMAELEENYRDSKPNNNVQLKNGMPCVALYPGMNIIAYSKVKCFISMTDIKSSSVIDLFVVHSELGSSNILMQYYLRDSI